MKSGLPLTWRHFPLQGFMGDLSPWVKVALLLAVGVVYLWVMNRLLDRQEPAPRPIVPARRLPPGHVIEDERDAA